VSFILLLFLVDAWGSNVVDVCLKYERQIIMESSYTFGMDAPWWLFMGQIEQESRCNSGITAFDGGMGLGQFMPETAEWMQERESRLKELGYDPYDPAWSIRALILYNHWLHQQTKCKGWYYMFRAYNGGAGILNKEISRAGCCDEHSVELACKRKVTKYKWGVLDNCIVNCKYPIEIDKKGRKYK
jgi:hypothetical protein